LATKAVIVIGSLIGDFVPELLRHRPMSALGKLQSSVYGELRRWLKQEPSPQQLSETPWQKRSFLSHAATGSETLKNIASQTLGKTRFDFVTFLTHPEKRTSVPSAAFRNMSQICTSLRDPLMAGLKKTSFATRCINVNDARPYPDLLASNLVRWILARLQ